MPAEIRDQIKEHAERAGLDVSTFLTIAACAQMDQQERVGRVFDSFRRSRAQAEADATVDTWTDEIELTPDEQSEVDAILGRSQRRAAA